MHTKQDMRKRRLKTIDTCMLPQDVVMEIVTRLPPKSLMRFKSVSKQWSSHISSQHFCNHIYTTVTPQKPRLYISLVDDETGERLLLSASSTSQDNNSSFVVDKDLSMPGITPGIGGYSLNVVCSLMCFSIRRKKSCIYNPSTKQLLTLPALKSDIIAEQGNRRHMRYYIGHDKASNQYKLVCTIAKLAKSSLALANLESEHWVLVLETGGVWKKVVTLENYQPHAPLTQGWFYSGSILHYMAWINSYICAVVSFDIKSEKFTIIHIPMDDLNIDVASVQRKVDIIEYGGKIAIFDHTHLEDEGFADLWVLENVEEEEWSKKKLIVQPCQRHLVHGIELIVKGTTKDGKLILAPSDIRSRFYFLYYDMRSNDLTRVEIKGVPELWFDKECDFDLKLMDESESFVYLET